jgi:Fe-S-cluster-containing hydrogenase component 2
VDVPGPGAAAPRAALHPAPRPAGQVRHLRGPQVLHRLPTLYESIQKTDYSKDYPIILTSGRLVEYEGGGDETRSNPWLAELQQDMFVEINPRDANNLGIKDGEMVWVEGPTKAKVKVKAMVTERVGQAWPSCRSTSAALPGRGPAWYPQGADPYVLGEATNTAQTYGYDSVTQMQETKATLCRIEPRHKKGDNQQMARMKFLCDAERCIECNACVTACKNEHEVPWGVNRRRVVTINDGKPGERSISVACMHCSDAPCMAVCPVDCFYQTDDGVVLHNKDLCIGCGYCFYACPFGAPQYPQAGQLRFPRQDGQVHLLRRWPGRGQLGCRVQEVRPQPPGRGQAAALRRRCARPRRCWPATATRCRTSTASASCFARGFGSAVPGAGAGACRTIQG